MLVVLKLARQCFKWFLRGITSISIVLTLNPLSGMGKEQIVLMIVLALLKGVMLKLLS